MNRIKSLILLSAVALVGLCPIHAQATTPEPSAPPSLVPSIPVPINLDFLTNLPVATDLSAAKFGISAGLLSKNGDLQNLVKVDAYVAKSWIISLEIDNASVASVVDSASIYGGYRKAWQNAELYGELGARRNWITAAEPASWQGVAILGAAWTPITGSHVSVFSEVEITTSPHGNLFTAAPGAGVRTGIKLFF